MWQGLDVFLAVVEHGSFSKAANVLDVSTSYVSRQIQQLEQRLGTILIHRTTRAQNLTDSGREYAVKLKVIQQELIDATNHIQGIQRQPKGLIRLSGAGDFVANRIAPVVAEFLQRYPEVSIEFDFNNRNIDLVEEGVDLAIRFGRLQDSNLIARKLCHRPMSLVASPEYITRHSPPIHPYELANHNCLIAINNRWRFNIAQQVEEVKVSGNWRSNNPHAILSACKQGLGIAHLAQDIVAESIKSGQLAYLLPEFQVQDNATWLVYPRKDLMPYRVRLLIGFLLGHFS